MDHRQENERKVHPWQRANIFSKITFLYTRGLFWRTYTTNKLEENDLYSVPTSFNSQQLGDKLEDSLELDLKTNESPSIYRLLWSCYGMEYLFIGLIQLIVRTIVVISIPTTLSKLVLYFQPNQDEISKEEAYSYAVLLIVLNMMNIIYTHNYMLIIAALGIKVKTAFCSLIYRKSLKLTAASLSNISVGKIVTLITKDVTAFEKIILYANDVWIGFVQAGIVCYLIYERMGVAAFAGVGFLLLVIPFQIYIGKKTSKFRTKTGEKTDERLQVTQETISAIKLIKMYVWENFFSKEILESRRYHMLRYISNTTTNKCPIFRREVNFIVKIFLTKVTILLIGGLTSKIAFYILVMTYVWQGNSVSAELVYFILTLFQRLRQALSVIVPMGITESAELHACVKRIESLLKAETLVEVTDNSIAAKPIIKMKNVTVTIDDKDLIKNVTATIESGLSILTGPLGCGKSILLKTILKDYKLSEGNVTVSGRISYASQEPWIFPSTLKQNIVFGEKFDQSRYEEVLRVCALKTDISVFEEGDNLIIGNKGINLSKGQKARINLARAVYKDCEIYLLDDCLTALDANVKDYITKECIRGFLKDKICILATTDMKCVQSGDTLIAMENGNIKSVEKVTNIDTTCIPREENENQEENGITRTNEDDVDNMENDNDKTSLLKHEKLSKTKNIYHEVKKSGKVAAAVYRQYILYGGGYFPLSFIIMFFVLTQSSKSYTEKLVSRWVDLEENLTQIETDNLTNTTQYEDLLTEHSSILILFSSLTLATTLLCIITAYLFFNFTRTASNRLHKAMVKNVMNAVMRFFDTTLIGNILNRFSNDLAIIDEYFPFDVYEFFEIFLALCGIIVILAIVNTGFLIPAAAILLVLFFIRKCYMPIGRNLQRLESATRSPVVGYLNASLEGLTTIRAFHAQKLLTVEFDKHQDHYTSTSFTNKCCARAFGLVLDISCTIFIAVITGYFLVFENDTSVGDVGLAITQAFMLSGLIQYGIRKWAELENKMTSVERVLEFTTQEEELKNRGTKSTNWPSDGKIEFENVSLLYTKETVLRNVTFTIEGKEKIGIVGRTGAGKTSIISTLFRLYDYEGQILIDGMNIADIDLEFLRKNIAIIPQDPILFTGTVRSNIDPLNIYEDSEIWSALKKVKLDHLITSSLDMKITESGLNFSSGQKQLLCLARAIVSKNKIVVLDEATSSVDDETDVLVHNVLDENFIFCTVITIAHKIKSVLKCDRVMLLVGGKIIEFDSPNNLLKNKNSGFYKMAEKSGLVAKDN